ncbi:E3 ubiquitin-protein ligase RBBP6-like isoform X2 [Ctenocephalides felis]|uniref:E3 ubiquitin-protein ligase RBBP6-like isoform X2 n=1 Tax=Ctenocephalides felis TaxID=7515 RepID=UPI000E6E56DD|nr:E3 ubiquitin-protein ligase RBBP6-like isoform X2 [Ctenocephalides felis]
MSVHYKFKSALEYDTITFDGLHISVKDLKKSILHQKRIGKTFDFDLQVTNAQTKEVYTDDNVLIPKNTSLIIARIPVSQTQKKSWDFASQPNASGVIIPSARPADNEAVADLSKMVGSEEDKIKAMISQSTMDYDPSNYQKVRGANQQGEVPPNYRCFKCHMAGHWIKNCPMTSGAETADIKRNTGIPRSFIVEKPIGGYGQPVINPEKSPSPDPIKQTTVVENKVEIPEDLQCMICKDLLSDAVMIPCCGSSFCDECIRLTLMESEDHECPDCKDKDISPVTMIPNRFLRNSVQAFKLETGYIKTRKYIPKKPTVHTPTSTHASADATVDLDSTANDKSVVILDASIDDSNKTETDHTQENEESGGTKNTVISEADSTQNGKFKETKEVQEKTAEKTDEQTPTVDDTTEVEKPAVVERPPGTEVESDGDDDNITVTMPPPHLQGHGALRNGRHIRPFLRPPGVETPPHYQRGNYNNNGGSNADKLASILDDQRPGTPTVDEQRLPVSSHMGSVSNTAPARTNAMQQEPPGDGYNIPNMAGNYSSSQHPNMPPSQTGMPPHHVMHSSGPPLSSQPIHTAPNVYGHNATPAGGPMIYPPSGAPNYGVPSAPHMPGYIAPQPHYDSRAVPPPHYDRPRPSGPLYNPRPPMMGVPPSGPSNYGAPPPGISGGPPRPIGPGPPIYGPPAGPRSVPEVADKALEAFNRMMREKDERARRREEREHMRRRAGGDGRRSRSRSRATRSRSRSLSRSTYGESRGMRSRSRSFQRINYSRSPRSRTRSVSRSIRKMTRSPIRRSRTPRRRTRSRSKSFSISRSPSPRGGDYSPVRRHHPRYRSPLLRTPPRYLHKEGGGNYRGRRDYGSGEHHYGGRQSPPPRNDYYGGHHGGSGDHYSQIGSEHQSQGPPPYHRGPRGRGGRGGGSYHHHGHRGGGGDYYGGMANDTGYGRYSGRDKRGSPPPRGAHYPPPLMSLKSPGVMPVQPYHQEQRYEHDVAPIGHQPPAQQYGLRPLTRYEPDLPPPGLDQPPPPGFEPTPPTRYRDEPPTDRFETTGGYQPEDYRMPPEDSRDRRDFQENPPQRPRKEEPVKDKYEGRSRERAHSRSRHRLTPSPEVNKPRERNSSADRYSRKPRPSKDGEKSSSSSAHPKREREHKGSERKEGDSRSKEKLAEEEKLKERKAKEEKREKKRKKKEAEKKKRKEEKKREKEEKSKVKKTEKPAAGKIEETSQDQSSVSEKDKTEAADVSMESTKSDDVPSSNPTETEASKSKATDLYGDILTEGIDSKVIENYGKILQSTEEITKSASKENLLERDGSFDGLEIQANESDLLNIDISPKKSSAVLATLPEPSRWELDETDGVGTTPKSIKTSQAESPRAVTPPGNIASNKVVTNEVLKRAENAIFAKAINAIRPIEIKKISSDRIKLYSGEAITTKDEREKTPERKITSSNQQILITTTDHTNDAKKTTESSKPAKTKITGPGSSPPSRVSVRERLGGKVDENTGTVITSGATTKRSRTRTPPRQLLPEAKRAGRDRDKETRDRERTRDSRHVGVSDRRLDSKVSRPDRGSSSSQSQHRSSNSAHFNNSSRDRNNARPSRSSYDHQSRNVSSRSGGREGSSDRSRDRAEYRTDGNSKRNAASQQRRRSRSRSRSKSGAHRADRSDKDKGYKRHEDNTRSFSSKKSSDMSSSRNPENPQHKTSSSNDEKFSRRNTSDQESNTQSHREVPAAVPSAPRRSALVDESNFEPDYDEHLEPNLENDHKQKTKQKDNLANQIKNKLKRAHAGTDSSSSSDSDNDNESSSDSSSSSGSDSDSKSKKKNKKRKKKKRKASKRKSSSDEDDEEADNDGKSKKRKHKRNKQLKKKKKSKHK